MEEKLHAFLTSTLDGGELPASRSGHFNPTDRAPGTHQKIGWVGPRVDLEVMANRKVFVPAENRTLAIQSID
jgi:hypothetical protein